MRPSPKDSSEPVRLYRSVKLSPVLKSPSPSAPPRPLSTLLRISCHQTPISTLGVIGSSIAIAGTLLYSLAKSKFG